MYTFMGWSCQPGRWARLSAISFWTGQPQASKKGTRFFCTVSENFFTHKFILLSLSLGRPERVWYSAKSWMNGSHPKVSWSWKDKEREEYGAEFANVNAVCVVLAVSCYQGLLPITFTPVVCPISSPVFPYKCYFIGSQQLLIVKLCPANLGQMLSRTLMDKEPLNKRQLLSLALCLMYYPDLKIFFPQPDWVELLIDWDHISPSLQNQWRKTLECSSLRSQGLLLNPDSKFLICCLSACFWTNWLNSQLMVYEPVTSELYKSPEEGWSRQCKRSAVARSFDD